MIAVPGQTALQLTYLATAIASLILAVCLLSRKSGHGPGTRAASSGMALTACWAVAAVGIGLQAGVTMVLLSLTYLAWLTTLYRLFARDERDKSVGPIKPVVMALALVELMQLALLFAQNHYAGMEIASQIVRNSAVIFRLLFCVGALVLVHNLYVGTSRQARTALRWPAAALAGLWLYDLNLSTFAYLGGSMPELLLSLRGVAMLPVIGVMAFGLLSHSSNLRFSPSRSFTFQSFSLLVIGVYLGLMVLVAQALSYMGSDLGRVVQLGFVAVATAAAVVILPSSRLRGWLKVTVFKHLFQHRYDYRAEWLRFNETIGRAGPAAAPLRERIVQAVADIADSPSGLLLTPRDDGVLALDARWQWPGIEIPGEGLSAEGARFFEQSQFILDLDDLRKEQVEGLPLSAHPDWLLDDETAWAMVPLLHYERLVGLIVLARPTIARRLDWEDFDLLRVVGRQLASYLAEQASQDALGEAQRFDEFNRRMAFVMHDIKNLASQLSLLAGNAEKHAEKPEFRADMLITLRNSTDKLQALLARLGRYGTLGRDERSEFEPLPLLKRLAADFGGQHEIIVIDRDPCRVLGDPGGLEQALVHLLQNAVDASPKNAPVFIELRVEASNAMIEVVDSGCGMSPEFVRTRLFKPFHSSKAGGFGIGAYEAYEMIRAMGGRLDVESREDLGTRFLVSLPLARTIQSDLSETNLNIEAA